MKVVPFQVPQTKKEAFRIQIDRLPHFYDRLHLHHEVQIMLIEKSEGTLVAGDYVGRFEAGDLFVLGSSQAHVFRNDELYYRPESKLMAESLSIYFDENYLGNHFWQLDEMMEVRQMVEQAACGLKIVGETRVKVIDLIRSMINQKGIDKLLTFFSILKLLAESNEVKKLSVSAPLEAYSGSEGKRMNEILQFTFRESHRKIYIEEVAKVANLSTEAFCRYFKLRTRKTYTNFLNEVRVSNACKLLINEDQSVQEVCYQVGFTNLSNFNRIFKKVTGKTPSGYLG